MNGATGRRRFEWIAIPALMLTGLARAGDEPLKKSAPPENDRGWIPLFDAKTASGWKIDGDHEIVHGALVLGGARKTRAYLPVNSFRNGEIRYQYRTEGTASASVGWDSKRHNGVPIPVLVPRKEWEDSFLQEYFDLWHFQQRFIKHSNGGASGVFEPIEALWFEVPAGNKLYLRDVRLREAEGAAWHWLLGIPLAFVAVVALILWRWRKKKKAPEMPRANLSVPEL